MTRSPRTQLLGLVAPLALASCGPHAASDAGSDSVASNPRILWLAPLGRDETRVSLVDTEPPPF